MSDRALAERLVRLAGAVALEFRGAAAEVKGAATDVVTEADRRAEAALLELLRAERPARRRARGGGQRGGRRRAPLAARPCRRDAQLRERAAGVVRRRVPGGRGRPARLRGLRPRGGRAVQRRARGGRDAERRAAAGGRAAGARRRGRGDVRRRRRRDAEVAAGTEALLRRVGALRAVGCGTLELAWTAAGRMHGWVQADVEPWDWHPGALLVAEAGGAVAVAGRWHAAAGVAVARRSGCVVRPARAASAVPLEPQLTDVRVPRSAH